MNISVSEYKDKVLACWMGKNIGGTLGAPMEFYRQINEVDFYTQKFDNPLPNDDLDIQVLWLIMLEEKGVYVTAELLGEYWQRYITPHWGEYGIAKVNMKSGILPPMSGTNSNPMFKDSNGAFIRSEIWACLAPGNPNAAVSYAINDAVIDHGNGEGTWGEVFCAALESSAFVEKDIFKLIDIGLSYIPKESGMSKAIHDAVACYKQNMTLMEARTFMLEHHRGHAFLGRPIQAYDLERGFDEGKYGYDCPLNVAIVILGLLYGEGDFDKTMRSTIYFGEDTDCTIGTAGSVFGILYGMSHIPDKWTKPIGSRIVTGCLNLGELGIYGDILPQTIEEMTDRVYKQHLRVVSAYSLPLAVEGDTTDLGNFEYKTLYAQENTKRFLVHSMESIVFKFDFYNVYVTYGNDCNIIAGQPRKIRICIENNYKTADYINLRWLVPDSVSVSPFKDGRIFLMLGGFYSSCQEVDFEFVVQNPQPVNRYVLELTIDGRTTTMYVPVVLYNGNLIREVAQTF